MHGAGDRLSSLDSTRSVVEQMKVPVAPAEWNVSPRVEFAALLRVLILLAASLLVRRCLLEEGWTRHRKIHLIPGKVEATYGRSLHNLIVLCSRTYSWLF